MGWEVELLITGVALRRFFFILPTSSSKEITVCDDSELPAEIANKGVNWRSKNVTGIGQHKPESPTVTHMACE